MKGLVTLFMLFSTLLLAQTLSPIQEIKANAYVYDMVVDSKHLYIGTGKGTLQVYDYHSKKFIKTITLPKIKDFMGDEIYPKVFSVDYINGKYLLLSEAKSGYRELYIHENNSTEKIISIKDKQAIAKAKFVDTHHIFLANLGNEVMLYNLDTKKEKYRFQISQSKFSDFDLNEQKDRAIVGCESGELSLVDIQKGTIVKVFKGQNLDNTYKVAIKKNIVTGAGQDRRGSYYKINSGSGGYFEGSFLIYATALSPSAKLAAYAMNEENDIIIYNLDTKQQVALLKGQKSTLNTIVFLDEQHLFSASSDPKIMMWKLTN